MPAWFTSTGFKESANFITIITSFNTEADSHLSDETPPTHCFQTHAKSHIQRYKNHQVTLKTGKLRGKIAH